jgi:hypothetical protein
MALEHSEFDLFRKNYRLSGNYYLINSFPGRNARLLSLESPTVLAFSQCELSTVDIRTKRCRTLEIELPDPMVNCLSERNRRR